MIYVSKKLSQAEQNYSNIEREAFAIVFVVTRLKQFLHGRRFTLQTDHKPLKYLFAPDKEIPKTTSARITRWAIALMGFDFELKYTPGEQIPHADALSRLHLTTTMTMIESALLLTISTSSHPTW